MSGTAFKVDGYLVVAHPSEVAPDHVWDFWLFEEVGTVEEPGGDKPLYGNGWTEPESFDGLDLMEMEPVARGGVKWDGCSNWDFQPEGVMMHFCEPECVDRLAGAVKACIARAETLIPAWNG